MEALDKLKCVDVQTVNPDGLIDIRDVKIDAGLPESERFADFVHKIKNPYCYKCGGIIVKLVVPDDSAQLGDRFIKML